MEKMESTADGDTTQRPDSSSTTSRLVQIRDKLKMKKWLRIDSIVLVIILLVIWILLSLPAIFFYIPIKKSTLQIQESTNRSSCNDTINYSGDVCREHLLNYANPCGNSSMPSVRVFHDASLTIPNLISGLRIIGSTECIEAAVPFICLYYFGGVCDINGEQQVASSSDCSALSNGVCQTEWKLGQQVGFDLPICEQLPAVRSAVRACAKTSPIVVTNNNRLPQVFTPSDTECPICQKNFICDDFDANATFSCVPRCPDWSLFTPAATLAQDIVVGFSAVVGAIAGVTVIVVSIIRRKKVLTFPSILVFYETISMLFLIFFQIVTYMDRYNLYCVSPDLMKSIQTATSFCIMTGMVTISIPVQLNIWWVTHMVVLFWTVRYPIMARTLRAAKGLRVVHITSLILGLMYPLLPIIATIVDDALKLSSSIAFGKLGFGFSHFPPNLCTGRNPHIVFYVVIFPSVILMQLGTTCLVLLIWTIHRRHGIINSLKSKASSLNISTAELKLLLVFIHYIFLQVISFVYFTQSQMVSTVLTQRLLAYFTCEVNGYNPNNPCSRSGFENLLNPGVATVAFSLIMLVPLSSIVFVVDFRDVKDFMRSSHKKFKDRFVSKDNTLTKSPATASTMDILDSKGNNTLDML